MELLQLKYFVESARCENFSVVANKYFVPVSSVSATVRKLEKELGCSLFDRNKNKISLNKRGKMFYDDINTALNLISSAKEKVMPEGAEELGSINMLIRAKKGVISEKVVEFLKNNENITFHFTHSYSESHDEYDIIIDEQTNVYKGYIMKPVIKEKIKIAASKNNPLIKNSLILNDLKHLPFITTSEGSSLNKITKSVCQNVGFNPNIVIESDDNADLIKYIEEDFGVAFVSEKIKEYNPSCNIGFLNVTDFDYNRVTYIYLNDNIKVSPAAKKFFDYMGEIGF